MDSRKRAVQAWAPGRTEIAGNHTDHQGGCVIAATIDCGLRMRVQSSGTRTARVCSDGFENVEVSVDDTAPRDAERRTTTALVRGVVDGLRGLGVAVDGFDAEVTSSLPPGGGLSSSAAFELALARALELLYSPCEHDAYEMALLAQRAERLWFGKPCGLMDQLSIALGGLNEIDFSTNRCGVQKIDFNFAEKGYALCLVDTHCDHSDYTEEYARVARDMFDVASFMGRERLCEMSREAYLERLGEVREALGDRAALRGLHYYNETLLVELRSKALRAGDMAAFLAATRRSAASSASYLQNVSVPDERTQPAMIALALADMLSGAGGAARIHGGGFGGTVQVFLPDADAVKFAQEVDAQLGVGSCRRFEISSKGAYARWVE